MRPAALLLIPLALVGLAGAVVAVAGRDSDAAFVFNQRNPAEVSALELQTLIAKAREPVPSGKGSRTLSVRCEPGSQTQRHNPWICRVRYASGRSRSYRVTVEPSGAYAGVDRTGQFSINGCCVAGGR